MTSSASPIKVGSKVRLIGIPEGLPNPNGLPTRDVFEKCLGYAFTIVDFNVLGMAELDVGSVTERIGESIWVEKDFLDLIME